MSSFFHLSLLGFFRLFQACTSRKKAKCHTSDALSLALRRRRSCKILKCVECVNNFSDRAGWVFLAPSLTTSSRPKE